MSISHSPHTTYTVRPSSQNDSHTTVQPRIGALLVHGLNGSKRDMNELADTLASHGILAECILLPGHGTHIRDMLTMGWPDWVKAVHDELHHLRQQCDYVFLIGHSLGGALCLHVAAHEEVAGIVTMCAPLHMHPWTRPAVKLAKRILPMVPTIREDVRDPEARKRYTRDVYRWTAMAPVESMLMHLPLVRAELPLIHIPALVMVSLRDHVVPASDGREIYRLLGSHEKHLVTFHHSYHVIMKDHDREEVFAKTLAFLKRHARQGSLRHEAKTTN